MRYMLGLLLLTTGCATVNVDAPIDLQKEIALEMFCNDHKCTTAPVKTIDQNELYKLIELSEEAK